MKTNGIEININDLFERVIKLTKEKMLAEAKVERQQEQIDALTRKLEQWEATRTHGDQVPL